MARISVLFSYLTLFCLISILTVTRGDYYACQQEGPCMCHFDNEESLDLTHLLPDNKFISGMMKGYTFYYHGCQDVNFHNEVLNITQNNCTTPLTLCLYNETDRTFKEMGHASKSFFRQDKLYPHLQEIVYQHDNLTTIVTLICTNEFPEAVLDVKSMDKNINMLNLFSSHACRRLDYIGLSTGTKLIVTLLVLGSIYFFAGSLLNYYLRGARGKEIIPNIDFWTSLPGLVKDGVVFVMNGCNSRMVTTADSYDQI